MKEWINPFGCGDPLNVFLSWSGSKSKAVAQALRAWLPNVIQGINEPWMSDRDLGAGVKWDRSISEALDAADIGIICVTQENQEKVWLNFEAGAISRSVEDREGRVIPLLIDFDEVTDLKGPLSTFQAVKADRAGVRSVLEAIDGLASNSLGEVRLTAALDAWWSQLQAQFDAIGSTPAPESNDSHPERDEKDILREVLSLVRDIARRDTDSAVIGRDDEHPRRRVSGSDIDEALAAVNEIVGSKRVSSISLDANAAMLVVITRDLLYDEVKRAVRASLRRLGYQVKFDVDDPIDLNAVRGDSGSEARTQYNSAQVRKLASQLAPGVRVRHSTFGDGTVVDVAGEGERAHLTIRFDEEDTRRLVLRYAPLELL